jgi:hypothetical protein
MTSCRADEVVSFGGLVPIWNARVKEKYPR